MTVLLVPRGLKGLAPLSIDMTSILTAEGRIKEVAAVTPTKAPELLSMFNMTYLDCSKYVALLEQEHIMAKRQADKVRSVVVLERAPQILLTRGLSTAKNPAGSEDLRRAVLDGDEEYQIAMQLVSDIHCYLDLLKGKQKGIEMAYTSVKKCLGENAFNFGHRGFSAGNEGNAQAGDTIDGNGKTVAVGFGKARY